MGFRLGNGGILLGNMLIIKAGNMGQSQAAWNRGKQ